MQQKHVTLALGILASTFLLTSCGGGKESSTTATPILIQTEIINGQTVPLAPDPAINNSTLVGVDSNKNGVRDDVERLIAITNNKTLTKEMEAAKYAQTALTIKTKEALSDFNCALLSLDPQIEPVLRNAIFNNKTRRDLYNQLDGAAVQVISIPIPTDGSPIRTSCRVTTPSFVE